MSESNKGQNRLDFDLRTRIAAVLRLHQWRATVRMTDDDPVLDCTCGMAFGPHREAHGNTFDCYRDHVADAVIRELELADTVRLLRAAQVWIADAISEDLSGEPWLMARTLLNQLVSRVDFMGGWADE